MPAHKEHLDIEGMGCNHCVDAVRTALTNIPSVSVTDVAIGHADVTFDPEEASREDLVSAVEKAGFSVSS